jgi:hypothetical protein
MCPGKRELGHSMIKSVRIQADDICVSSLVIGMTMSALGTGDAWCATVKAAPPGNVARDILVTGKTQIVLTIFFKRCMALIAVGFELRVTLDD